MPYHRVQQGEYLGQISRFYGLHDYHAIYDHPKNAKFKEKHPNPNVLDPGDLLFIPEARKKSETGSTDERHQFKLKTPPIRLRIVLKDHLDEPIRNAPCTLRVGEGAAGKTITANTDGEGLLDAELPAGCQQAQLDIGDTGFAIPLRIGHLDPVHDGTSDKSIINGIQARLTNLGYSCGKIDGVFGPRTRVAVARFQREVLKREYPTGKLDVKTRKALQTKHGC